jgi:hypothetical protein
MMALSHNGSTGPISYATQHEIPADLGLLPGDTITHVEKSVEIDPVDGCKVEITRYDILSQDGTEESTITRKRKLKINCTQSLRRTEYTNGREEKFEEETRVLGNLDMLNGYNGIQDSNALALQNGYHQVSKL